MRSMDVTIDLGLGEEAGSEVTLSIDFKITSAGCPAHMGDLNYPGHPAEPMEIEIETIFWPCKTRDEKSGEWKDDHFKFPINGLPDDMLEAIEAYIVEHYVDDPDPADYGE